MMNSILRDVIDGFGVVYPDPLPICSKTEEERRGLVGFVLRYFSNDCSYVSPAE